MFDGIVTRAIVAELNKELKNAKVNKIMQPTKNEVILETYGNGKKHFLKICVSPDSCSVCFTDYLKSNPKNVYNFCMLLRKHLTGSKILEISNLDLERTIEIEFEARNELNDLIKKRLYIEIMSRQSNVILTNEDSIIIDTLKHFECKDRELLPAHKFTFTPILKTSFLKLKSFEEFLKLVSENNDELISQKLPAIFIGFSKNFVLNVITEIQIDDKNYSENDLEKLYDYIKELLDKLETNEVTAVLSDKDFNIILGNKTSDLQINEAVDKFYSRKEQKDVFAQSKNNLLRIISSNLKKVNKKLENINQKLKECDDMDKYKLYGELLTASLYKIDGSQNLSEIQVFDYYQNKDIIIKLDSKFNVTKNIEKFFKKYNKLKNTLVIVSEQKKETENELDYIESVIFAIENAKNMQDINEIYEEVLSNFNLKKSIKKDNTSKKKEEIEIEPIDILGYKVYVGKNNVQNEFITLKLARKSDLWFHTQKIQGSHVLLRTEGKDEIPEEVIFECAKLAKENSKAKNGVNVPVDYVEAKYIKRHPSHKVRNGNLYEF